MKERRSVFPPQVSMRAKELEQLSRLAHARHLEARLRIRPDDFASMSATDRILALELMELLGTAQKLVHDVTILVANSRPPAFAEYLLYLVLGKEERETVIGDLVQEYGHIRQRFGKRKANTWFHKQVIWSFWPFLRRAVVRCVALVWVGLKCGVPNAKT